MGLVSMKWLPRYASHKLARVAAMTENVTFLKPQQSDACGSQERGTNHYLQDDGYLLLAWLGRFPLSVGVWAQQVVRLVGLFLHHERRWGQGDAYSWLTDEQKARNSATNMTILTASSVLQDTTCLSLISGMFADSWQMKQNKTSPALSNTETLL